MIGPFASAGDGVAVLLAPAEREVLRTVPILLRNRVTGGGEPVWARLRSVGHLDDPEASERFVELTAAMLESAAATDLDRFEATLEDDVLDPADAECWMRAIGEARLQVAARLGIEDESWEDGDSGGDLVETTVLRVLGYLQDALVAALSERI